MTFGTPSMFKYKYIVKYLQGLQNLNLAIYIVTINTMLGLNLAKMRLVVLILKLKVCKKLYFLYLRFI